MRRAPRGGGGRMGGGAPLGVPAAALARHGRAAASALRLKLASRHSMIDQRLVAPDSLRAHAQRLAPPPQLALSCTPPFSRRGHARKVYEPRGRSERRTRSSFLALPPPLQSIRGDHYHGFNVVAVDLASRSMAYANNNGTQTHVQHLQPGCVYGKHRHAAPPHKKARASMATWMMIDPRR